MGVLAIAESAQAGSARHAIKPAPKVVVQAKGKVLRGDVASFTAIAVVDRKAVFAKIPAYRQLQKEQLDRRSPRYHFLLKEANEVFNRTLDRAARHFAVDLICEDGALDAVGIDVLDLTDAMRQAVAAQGERKKKTPAKS